MSKSSSGQRPSPLQRFWDLFASVKLSFALLIALAVASVAGTLIPQKEAPQAYLRLYGETGAAWVQSLGLHDMYHAPWFLILLALLAANLLICSAERLPAALKIIRKDPASDLGRTRPADQSFKLDAPLDKAAQNAEAVLARRFGRVHKAADAKGVTLYAQKGALSRLGVYVVHLSVLVILAGALLGSVMGFHGRVNIHEGEVTDTIFLDNGQPLTLPFQVRLDDFDMSHYPNGMVSEYRSDLVFLKDGKAAYSKSIVVNDPASFQGVDFYQSSYGQSPTALEVAYEGPGAEATVKVKPNRWTELPGGAKATLVGYREHVDMGQMYHGPLARIGYQPPQGEPVLVSAFGQGFTMPRRGEVGFTILDAETVFYSGLQVKYDPGVWLFYIGSTVMVLGFIWTFYFSHRKVWVWLRPAGQAGAKVELAMSANKNRGALKLAAVRLADEMQRSAGGEGK